LVTQVYVQPGYGSVVMIDNSLIASRWLTEQTVIQTEDEKILTVPIKGGIKNWGVLPWLVGQVRWVTWPAAVPEDIRVLTAWPGPWHGDGQINILIMIQGSTGQLRRVQRDFKLRLVSQYDAGHDPLLRRW
jgi:hypothetical protein